MNSTVPAGPVIAAGLALGLLGDVLLRAEGAFGLNMFVLIAAALAAALLLRRGVGTPLGAEARVLLAAGLLFAATLVWRDSPFLKLLALGGVVVSFALPGFRAGADWLRRTGIGEYIAALVSAVLHGAFGALRAAVAIDWSGLRNASAAAGGRHTIAALRGAVLAVPFVVVFGALLVGADPVFGRIVADLTRVDLEWLSSHVVVTGFLAWISIGCLHGALAGTRPGALDEKLPRGRFLGVLDTSVALGLVGIVFVAFVAVQFRYLFGGGTLVEVTPGLTYAEYARRGFFELAGVVALTVPMLLAADWALRRAAPRDQAVFAGLAGALVLLVLVIAASALRRMQLYVDAYGLTELRFYATSFLVLLAFILLWFLATVLRERRPAFALGTLTAGLLTAAALIVANPDAVVARTNIARALSGNAPDGLDVAYATSVSADAAPILIHAMPQLSTDAQCRIADRLLTRWGPQVPASVRTWNWSVTRTRSLVAANAARLRQISEGECPG